MRVRVSRKWIAGGTAGALLLGLAAVVAWAYLEPASSTPTLGSPSQAGLNYGFPHGTDGRWLGTRWLRSGGTWEDASPALAADLDFIRAHGLGRTIRLFVGLDQTMVWDENAGFDGFDEAALRHFGQALDMLDARGFRAVIVIFDQEEVASPGNFHFESLDGRHEVMRRHYLTALEEFLHRFGSRTTVIGWDLFNEAYNSLGRDGGLPQPPHPDPVSPGYSDATVHAWLADLYRVARASAPSAKFTVSDATELYWNPDPDLTKYRDVVDFYDVHVYDDRPVYPAWGTLLDKPYIVGEAGASTAGGHYDDQAMNSQAVAYLLSHARSAGVSFVLVQGQSFTLDRRSLTPTGVALAAFLSTNSDATHTPSRQGLVDWLLALAVSTARRAKRALGF